MPDILNDLKTKAMTWILRKRSVPMNYIRWLAFPIKEFIYLLVFANTSSIVEILRQSDLLAEGDR